MRLMLRRLTGLLLPMVLVSFFFLSCSRPNAAKSKGPHYKDYSARLDRVRLSKLLEDLSTNTQLTLEETQERLKKSFGSFRSFSNLNDAYWTLLSYKYYSAIQADDFRDAGVFDFRSMMESLIHENAEGYFPAYPSHVIGMLHGLQQFHISRRTSEHCDEILDRLYWGNEKYFITALLQTNVINGYFLDEFSKIRERTYELPIGSLASLYRYEEGGISFEAYKWRRINKLMALRQEFPVKDRWIFTKTNFEPKRF